MTAVTNVLQRYPLPISANRLQDSANDIERQIEIYENIAHQFRERHGCTLEIYERQITEGKVPEHPSWEESLEWGVALDEIERLRTIQKALQWILNLLR